MGTVTYHFSTTMWLTISPKRNPACERGLTSRAVCCIATVSVGMRGPLSASHSVHASTLDRLVCSQCMAIKLRSSSNGGPCQRSPKIFARWRDILATCRTSLTSRQLEDNIRLIEIAAVRSSLIIEDRVDASSWWGLDWRYIYLKVSKRSLQTLCQS